VKKEFVFTSYVGKTRQSKSARISLNYTKKERNTWLKNKKARFESELFFVAGTGLEPVTFGL